MSLGTVKRRMLGRFAFAMSLVALQAPIPISMFDWPEHSHTSPTSTSCAVLFWFPSPLLTVRVRDSVDAGILSRCAIHLPSASATAVLVWPANETVTLVPGFAHPHTGTFTSR